ncbi:MAG TPA: PHB depolymerase family esterase [Polyangiaceae bacterium]|jgi:polyhydroxybutyrate depolymerase|nr:PHB depolymerase family esterase [Polyangiaceae bacterium]
MIRPYALVLGLVPLVAACSNDTLHSLPEVITDAGVEASHDAAPSCHGKLGVPGDSVTAVMEPGAPDGGLRSSLVHVPTSYDPATPAMLVLNFHGLLEPASLQASVSHMSDTADQRGFIVAYPEGLSVGVGLSWNAGTCCGNSTDDVGFIRDLVKKLEDDYCIDPKRVFATGLSNGAMLSYRLGCEAADVFAAVAPVAGAVVLNPCTPSRPVPILAIHGTGDTIVPFNGGTDGIYHVLDFPPVSYSIELWRHLDECPSSPAPEAGATVPMPDESSFDGGPNADLFTGSTLVSQKGDSACHSWTGCKQGSEVELCTVVDGGHSWPGGPPLVGKSSMDIDATTTVIDFFEKHPMP